jgi:glycosyltransferase involved in cell wall biosynthesis
MTQTDITVIIPTHNRQDTLPDAVNSIFGQTLLPRELILIDDGSSPPVPESVFFGAPANLRVRLLRNERPMGASRTRNRGVKEAAGPWVAFLDDDDVFLPEKLHRISQAIRENPEAELLYHPAKIRFVNEGIEYISNPGSPEPHSGFFRRMLVRNEVGGTSMVVVRKEVLMDAGGFWEDLPALEDYELWLRLVRKGIRFMHLKEPLTKYIYNTKKRSITKSQQAREEALAMIERRYESDYRQLNPDEKNRYAERNLRAYVFKALLNRHPGAAFHWQWRVFAHTKSLKDLGMLLVIPLGIRTVLYLRSVYG